tara:strand:+ start:444 stop:806 length:363 start_codon:yes stop_codon:yes gene_type:complete
MKNNHPIWEGHQFNTYKSKKACYNNTTDEEKLIREQHTKEKNVKKLEEWVARPMGGVNSSLGSLDIPKDNHGLTNDRTGLVVNHLGEVSRYVKEESISEFVQDFSEQQKKLRKIDIRRTK